MKTHILLFGMTVWLLLAAVVAGIFQAWLSCGAFIIAAILMGWAAVDRGMEYMLKFEEDEE